MMHMGGWIRTGLDNGIETLHSKSRAREAETCLNRHDERERSCREGLHCEVESIKVRSMIGRRTKEGTRSLLSVQALE